MQRYLRYVSEKQTNKQHISIFLPARCRGTYQKHPPRNRGGYFYPM